MGYALSPGKSGPVLLPDNPRGQFPAGLGRNMRIRLADHGSRADGALGTAHTATDTGRFVQDRQFGAISGTVHGQGVDRASLGAHTVAGTGIDIHGRNEITGMNVSECGFAGPDYGTENLAATTAALTDKRRFGEDIIPGMHQCRDVLPYAGRHTGKSPRLRIP
jgi:hypothetical protein